MTARRFAWLIVVACAATFAIFVTLLAIEVGRDMRRNEVPTLIDDCALVRTRSGEQRCR